MAITLANMLTRQFKKRGTYEGYATSPVRLTNREEKEDYIAPSGDHRNVAWLQNQ